MMWPFRRTEDQSLKVLSLMPPNTAHATGLPACAILGSFSRGDAGSPQGFTPNPEFVTFLHDTLKQILAGDPRFAEAARRQHTGRLYVFDAKHRTDAGGSIPPEDIVCGVRVEDGIAVFADYFANPKYELFSPSRGTMQLPEHLHSQLLGRLVQRAGET